MALSYTPAQPWLPNGDGSVTAALATAAKGYSISGTAPVSVAGAGTSAGVFWSLTAPNGGASSGAVGGAGGSISETTGSAGASFSGGANGGDRIINLGSGTGTGRNGQFLVASTVQVGVVGAITGSSFTINYPTLVGAFAGTPNALDVVSNTDASSNNYTGIIRALMAHQNLNSTGGTYTYTEAISGVTFVGSGTSGTLVSGYTTGGEIIIPATSSMAITQHSAVLGQIEHHGSGTFGQAFAVQGLVTDYSDTTGPITTSAGVYGFTTHTGTQLWTSAYGVFGQAMTASGATGNTTVQAGGYFIWRQSAAGSTTAGAYGVLIDSPIGSGPVTNAYGQRINDQYTSGITGQLTGLYIHGQSTAANRSNLVVGGGLASGVWNIYSSATDNNALAGPLSLGSTAAPTASSLTMAAGWDILPAAGSTGMIAGFNYIPSAAGPPTGAPTNLATGRVAMYYDETNSQIYVRISGGAWKKTVALT